MASSPGSRRPWLVTTVPATSSGSRSGKLMFMTVDGPHSTASRLRISPGPCASAVCHLRPLTPSMPSSLVRRMRMGALYRPKPLRWQCAIAAAGRHATLARCVAPRHAVISARVAGAHAKDHHLHDGLLPLLFHGQAPADAEGSEL